ncbi:hypothetical protein MAL1_00250 [Bacteriophage DSS3_MAL1]|nr:hypothetical protein MAL1_00250 [Bacteriophage DSS3_MAL1]
MGYTHYWTHKRRFTNADWLDVKTDLAAIVAQAELEGVAIGDGAGDTAATVPDVYRIETGEVLSFNGIGEDSHETFLIYQNRRPLDSWQKPSQRGWDFCKTARKAYDVAVTACLIYLESRFPEHFSASSDGESKDWNAGLELAKRALPRLDNVLRIPAEVAFDSLFSCIHMRGGKYAIATDVTGDLCLIDDSRLAIVGYFKTPEAQEWVTEWARRVMAERQRKLPCNCDVLDRWEARKLRTFKDAAETLGYLAAQPVEAEPIA